MFHNDFFQGKHCPALEMLSLAECPVTSIPKVKPDDMVSKAGIRLVINNVCLNISEWSSWRS